MPFPPVLQVNFCMYFTILFKYFWMICTMALVDHTIYNDCI